MTQPSGKFAVQYTLARIRGIEHHQLLSLQPSLRPTAHEYRSFLCLLETAEVGLGQQRQGRGRSCAGGKGIRRHRHHGPVQPGEQANALRAPKIAHPRRVGSTFLLSGLVKCYRCKRALSGRYSSRGTFPYYVCHSFVKRAPGACDSPRAAPRWPHRRFVGLPRGKSARTVPGSRLSAHGGGSRPAGSRPHRGRPKWQSGACRKPLKLVRGSTERRSRAGRKGSSLVWN